MVIRSCFAFALFAAASVFAWFDDGQYADHVYIAYCNYVDVSPTVSLTAPEAGTVALPLTIRVYTESSIIGTLQTVKLQWSTGDGNWTDMDPVRTRVAPDSVDYAETQTAFGHYTLDTDTLSQDTSYLIRLYVSDGVFENANLAADTGENGTNGWMDSWVISLTTHASNLRPGRPTTE